MYTFDKNKNNICCNYKNPADSIGQMKAEMDWLSYLAQKAYPCLTTPDRKGELAFQQKKMVKPGFISAFVGWMVCDGIKTIEAVGIKVCFIIGVKL